MRLRRDQAPGLGTTWCDQETYSAIVVPSLLEKLPEQLRLTITRGEDHHEWNLEPLSDILGHEVELREEYHRNPRNTRNPQEEFKRKTSMHTGKQINCDFCLWGHNHEECKKVKNFHERKQSLVTFGRRFNCIRKGHLSRDCKTNVICKLLFFKGKDHSCLCSADSLREGESQKIWVITVLESQLGITRMLKQVKASFYKLHKPK